MGRQPAEVTPVQLRPRLEKTIELRRQKSLLKTGMPPGAVFSSVCFCSVEPEKKGVIQTLMSLPDTFRYQAAPACLNNSPSLEGYTCPPCPPHC